MLTIDGSQHSGSGTIVRYAVAFASLLGEPVRVVDARARRDTPGLRPQHATSVRAAAALCDAQLEGVTVGSREFTFQPRRPIRGGTFDWDIGTAGSTTAALLSLLPGACLADRPVTIHLSGGVFQDFAPSPHHLQHVLTPLLARMGATARIRVVRAGYVPRGGGVLQATIEPGSGPLVGLALTEPGRVRNVGGVAFASHLATRRVPDRMAETCERALAGAGLSARIERVDDTDGAHPGAGLTVWAETSTGCVLGADRAGAVRRRSESIGRFVADALVDDLTSGATVDRHVADQLVLFAAIARGTTEYLVPATTPHLETNLWLASLFGARCRRDGRRVAIDGLGLGPGDTTAGVAAP